jgi:hypothetical protein
LTDEEVASNYKTDKFRNDVSITFDGTACTAIWVPGDDKVSCKTPAHSAGKVDVAITIDGTTTTFANSYEYIDDPLWLQFYKGQGQNFTKQLNLIPNGEVGYDKTDFFGGSNANNGFRVYSNMADSNFYWSGCLESSTTCMTKIVTKTIAPSEIGYNQWGWQETEQSVSTPTNNAWAGYYDSATVFNTSNPTELKGFRIWYGAKANFELPFGDYFNSIIYTAAINP